MLKFISIIIFIFVFCLVGFAQGEKPKTSGNGNGGGRGSGDGASKTEDTQIPPKVKQVITAKTNLPLKITSKPRAIYTDQARQNQVQGTVVLRVTFKKDGSIGNIKIVKGLPDGLTQNTIEAAKKIRFEPAIKKGKPFSVTKNIEYTFTIY